MAAEPVAPAGLAMPAAPAPSSSGPAPGPAVDVVAAQAVTPQRWQSPPTLGTSPLSKRAARRVAAAFPDTVPNLTLEEVCNFVAQHKAQHACDKLWMDTVQVAITDHAHKLDNNEGVLIAHDKKIEGTELAYDHPRTSADILKSDLVNPTR